MGKDAIYFNNNRTLPHKVETWSGKETARVTQIFKQKDDSVVKATRRINKDLSISDIVEHRYKLF